jgi:hypothetical protein
VFLIATEAALMRPFDCKIHFDNPIPNRRAERIRAMVGMILLWSQPASKRPIVADPLARELGAHAQYNFVVLRDFC